MAKDETISRRVVDTTKRALDTDKNEIALSDITNPQYLRELGHRGYTVVDLQDVHKLTSVVIEGAEATGQKAIDDVLNLDIEMIQNLGKQKNHSLHVMPTVVAKDLMKMDSLLSNKSSGGEVFNMFLKTTGLWKAYALFSPGYHMRNMYSNWFQNWMAGVTDDKLYFKSLALQNGGTEKLPWGIRQVVERRIGKMSMGEGSRWAPGDDIWFEEGGTKLNGNQVNKLLDDHLVTDSGLFSRDIFVDTEKTLLKETEKNISRALYSVPTKVAQEMMDELEGTSLSFEEREVAVLIGERRIKTIAISEGISLDEAWKRNRWRVTPYDDIDAQNVDGAWLLQSGEKVHMDIINGPYGSRIEQAIDGAFRDNPMPTYDQLRDIPGLDIRRSVS